MTGSRACAEIRLELGVYVLGAIEAADRSAVDAHVAWCADCRGELADLAGLPRLLSLAAAGCSRPEVPARHGQRCVLRRTARLRQHCMRPGRTGMAGACAIAGAGAIAACGRQKVAPDRTCRAVMGMQGGDWAR
jgi:anti-sigma factor RsiW